MAMAADQQSPAGDAEDEWQRLISAGKEHLTKVPLPSRAFSIIACWENCMPSPSRQRCHCLLKHGDVCNHRSLDRIRAPPTH